MQFRAKTSTLAGKPNGACSTFERNKWQIFVRSAAWYKRKARDDCFSRIMKISAWTFLPGLLCLVAPSKGDVQNHSLPPEAISEYLNEKSSRYVMPRILDIAKKLEGYKTIHNNPKLEKLLRLLSSSNVNNRNEPRLEFMKRKFPEVDSRGFDEDIFDEGFGDWSPMKRW
ncbi:hypothetical protein JTE90_006233 [Oedothorax gibbosus]|uniref:Uncharacterized protein n=1 Tax=Oedothorax gibbosus TaxID=931172 RepID=A0AAV6VWY4_9ARAC|nr:hypothetical protein JTE90_006233 [Oedothorax gibbosus]